MDGDASVGSEPVATINTRQTLECKTLGIMLSGCSSCALAHHDDRVTLLQTRRRVTGHSSPCNKRPGMMGCMALTRSPSHLMRRSAVRLLVPFFGSTAGTIDQAACPESCSGSPVVLDKLTRQVSLADPITVSGLAHVKLGWRT